MSRIVAVIAIMMGVVLLGGCARQDAVNDLKQELQKTQDELKTLKTQIDDVDARLAQENHALQILASDVKEAGGGVARQVEMATADIQAQAKVLTLKIPEAIQPLSNQILQQAADIRALSSRVDTLSRDISRVETLARDASRSTRMIAPAAAPSAPAPSTPAPAAATPELFDGTWTAAFTFERNTRNTAEQPHPWIAFRMRLQQTGQQVTGTLEGTDNNVTGTVSGRANGSILQGTMRLSWDSHDWETFTLNLDAGGAGGNGTAVFRDSECEQHFYSIVLSR